MVLLAAWSSSWSLQFPPVQMPSNTPLARTTSTHRLVAVRPRNNLEYMADVITSVAPPTKWMNREATSFSTLSVATVLLKYTV